MKCMAKDRVASAIYTETHVHLSCLVTAAYDLFTRFTR